jgi:hypothetical protein
LQSQGYHRGSNSARSTSPPKKQKIIGLKKASASRSIVW